VAYKVPYWRGETVDYILQEEPARVFSIFGFGNDPICPFYMRPYLLSPNCLRLLAQFLQFQSPFLERPYALCFRSLDCSRLWPFDVEGSNKAGPRGCIRWW